MDKRQAGNLPALPVCLGLLMVAAAAEPGPAAVAGMPGCVTLGITLLSLGLRLSEACVCGCGEGKVPACGRMGCFSPGLVTRRSSGMALQGTWPSLRAPTISTASKVPVWRCGCGVVVCLQCGLRPPWRVVCMMGPGEGPGLPLVSVGPRSRGGYGRCGPVLD